MNENLPWLEKASSTSILISLFQTKDEISLSKLRELTKANISTIYARIRDLEKMKLIKKEEKPTVKDGIVIGGKTVYLSITPLGKKVAKKLLEIKEIMGI